MISILRAGERGHFDHGWLDTYHTFLLRATTTIRSTWASARCA